MKIAAFIIRWHAHCFDFSHLHHGMSFTSPQVDLGIKGSLAVLLQKHHKKEEQPSRGIRILAFPLYSSYFYHCCNNNNNKSDKNSLKKEGFGLEKTAQWLRALIASAEVQFPAPTWWLTTICNPSSLSQLCRFLQPYNINSYMHTHIYIKIIKI